jgi:hypothetical protein
MEFLRLAGDAILAVLYANMLVLGDAAQLMHLQQVGYRVDYLGIEIVKSLKLSFPAKICVFHKLTRGEYGVLTR